MTDEVSSERGGASSPGFKAGDSALALVETGQTIPDQLRQPTNRPTLRWVFQCFEGIELLHISSPSAVRETLVLRLQPLHEQILALLGPPYQQFYKRTN